MDIKLKKWDSPNALETTDSPASLIILAQECLSESAQSLRPVHCKEEAALALTGLECANRFLAKALSLLSEEPKNSIVAEKDRPVHIPSDIWRMRECLLDLVCQTYVSSSRGPSQRYIATTLGANLSHISILSRHLRDEGLLWLPDERGKVSGYLPTQKCLDWYRARRGNGCAEQSNGTEASGGGPRPVH